MSYDSSVDLHGPALQLLDWMRQRDWVGYDPFDGLRSPLAAPFRTLRWPAVAWTQAHRRLPVNLRPWVGIHPHVNPKALSLTLQGVLSLRNAGLGHSGVRPEELVDRLLRLEAPSGGWGYPFAWANRHFHAPAGTRSSVVTAFVGNALLDAMEARVGGAEQQEAVRVALHRGANFISRELQRVPAGRGFLFSYTPLDNRGVHNASILAAAFLARTAESLGPEAGWARDAETAARTTLEAQRPDGTWPYGTTRRDGFVDSYHTGYVLEALQQLTNLGILDGRAAIVLGLDAWRTMFLTGNGVAHRPGQPYPVDFHGVAQGMLTCLGFETLWAAGPTEALALAQWALEHGRDDDGSFPYQWWPGRVNRVPYLRWVQAWMFRALAACASHKSASRPPVPPPN